jgi:undecaprenyl-diphosphatase
MTAAWLVTDLGDLFVASAAGLAIVVWAWINLGRMTALAFWTCHAATFGLVTLIKLWTGRNLPQPDQVPLWAPSAGAPSGHAAMAAIVYGCAAAIFLKAGRGPLAAVGAALSILAIVLVAVTRVTLHTHSAADVAAGLAVAGGFVALFAKVLAVQVQDQAPQMGGLAASLLIVTALALASRLRISSMGVF